MTRMKKSRPRSHQEQQLSIMKIIIRKGYWEQNIKNVQIVHQGIKRSIQIFQK